MVPVGAIIAKIETNGSVTPNAERATPNAGQNDSANEEPSTPHSAGQAVNEERSTPDAQRQNESEIDTRPAILDARPAGNGQPSTIPATMRDQPSTVNENRFYSPLVLNIASNEGINLSELEKIPGTGNEGRITKKDILHMFLTGRTEMASIASLPLQNPLMNLPGKIPVL
ncbi:MAG: E3 binding domain-containing protein [Puia sp.]